MAGDFFRQGVGDQLAGTLLVFNPGRMWQGDPDWTSVHQELDIHRIGVPGGDGQDERVVEAVNLVFGTVVGIAEIVKHRKFNPDVPVNISPAGRGSKLGS